MYIHVHQVVECWPRNVVVVGLSPIHGSCSVFQACTAMDMLLCLAIYMYMYFHIILLCISTSTHRSMMYPTLLFRFDVLNETAIKSLFHFHFRLLRRSV